MEEKQNTTIHKVHEIAQLCSIIAVFYYCKAPILYAQHMHAAPGVLMSTHSRLYICSPLFIGLTVGGVVVGSEVGWGVVAPLELAAMVYIATVVDTIVVAVDDDGNTSE